MKTQLHEKWFKSLEQAGETSGVELFFSSFHVGSQKSHLLCWDDFPGGQMTLSKKTHIYKYNIDID